MTKLENIKNSIISIKIFKSIKMTEYLNKQLSREDIQMENEHMRKCSATVHYAEEQEFAMICCEYYILQTFSKTLCEFLIKLNTCVLPY